MQSWSNTMKNTQRCTQVLRIRETTQTDHTLNSCLEAVNVPSGLGCFSLYNYSKNTNDPEAESPKLDHHQNQTYCTLAQSRHVHQVSWKFFHKVSKHPADRQRNCLKKNPTTLILLGNSGERFSAGSCTETQTQSSKLLSD